MPMDLPTEVMEWMGPVMIGLIVVAGVIQLSSAYALQAMADKQDLSGLARFLAWVPPFNLYTALAVCGASLGRFLLVCIAGGGATAAIVVAVGLLGSELVTTVVGGVLAIAWSLGALFYFGRLTWNLAERRDLPGWIGLLALVPILGFFVFFYIAFHDGPVSPNKAGLVVGALLVVGPAVAQYQMVQQLQSLNAAGLLQAMLEQHESGEPAGTFRVEVSQNGTVGPDAAQQLQAMLASATATAAAAEEHGRGLEFMNEAAPAADASPGLPAAPAPIGADGGCPAGTAEMGAEPPRGSERWCARIGENKGLKHGPYARWHESGEIAVEGLYRDGLRVGTWSRFYPDGAPQMEASFRDGLQHGRAVFWSASGEVLREQWFDGGEVVPDT